MEKIYKIIEDKITKNELDSRYQVVLKREAKHVEIRGFRKGRVPLSLVEQMYGEQIKSISISELIEEKRQNHQEELSEKEVDIVGSVVVDNVDKKEDEINIIFKYYIPIPLTKEDLKFEEFVKIGKETKEDVLKDVDVDGAIAKIVTTYNPVEREVKVEDLVVMDIKVFEKDGEKLLQEERNITAIVTKDDDIVGKGKGTYKVEKDDHVIEYTIHEVKEPSVPEFTDDLAINYGYDSMDEMKKQTEANLEIERLRKINDIWTTFYSYSMLYSFMNSIEKGELSRTFLYDYIEDAAYKMNLPEKFRQALKKRGLFESVRKDIETGFYVIDKAMINMGEHFILKGIYLAYEDELKEYVDKYTDYYMSLLSDKDKEENDADKIVREYAKMMATMEFVIRNAIEVERDEMEEFSKKIFGEYRDKILLRVFDYLFLSGEDKGFESVTKDKVKEEIDDIKEGNDAD